MSPWNRAAAFVLGGLCFACDASAPQTPSEAAGAQLSKLAQALEVVADVDAGSDDAGFGLVESLAEGAPAQAALDALALVDEAREEVGVKELVTSHVRGFQSYLEALGRMAAGSPVPSAKQMMQVDLPEERDHAPHSLLQALDR